MNINTNVSDVAIKHLEFIQNNITRMGTNSFIIKGWTITVFFGLVALFIANKDTQVFYKIISIVPIFMFWYLDTYYLQQERMFRGIYNDVAHITPIGLRHEILPFDMPLKLYSGGEYSFWKVFFSKPICPLYVIIIFTILIICFI
jgi:hypothetical protein